MAVEMRDGKKILFTPISAEDLKDIHIGDIVYLTGDITTCRDVAHRRVVEEGREIPVDVRDAAILHAGPIIRPLGDEKYEMVSVGPTTSMRMEKFEYEFVQTTGVRVIVGKGGMKENTERACKDFGAIHCVFPAGNAVVGAVVHVNLMRCAAAGAVVVHTVFYITANSVDYVFFHHGASPFLVRHKSVCFCVLYQYGQNTPEYTAGGAYGNFCGW